VDGDHFRAGGFLFKKMGGVGNHDLFMLADTHLDSLSKITGASAIIFYRFCYALMRVDILFDKMFNTK